MPVNSSETFIMLKPQEESPYPELFKAELQDQLEKTVSKLSGNKSEFSQPIQLRFNDRHTRRPRRQNLGEEFGPMLQAQTRTLRSCGHARRRVSRCADDRAAVPRYQGRQDRDRPPLASAFSRFRT